MSLNRLCLVINASYEAITVTSARRTLTLVFKGAAGSQFALFETLTRATPLIFTGLAAAVAFRAKLWNIGGEAQLYMGAVATIVFGTGLLSLPAPILLRAAGTTNWHLALRARLPHGRYHVAVTAVDSAGNRGPPHSVRCIL